MKSFIEYLSEENNQCALITKQDLAALEQFADRLLDKFGIDIEFTKHFGDRMSDDRNNPCITLGELKDLFQKIYANKGKKIRKARADEAVLKDIQSNLNLPIVIDVDRKGDLDITLKTIMRKKKFSSPDPAITY